MILNFQRQRECQNNKCANHNVHKLYRLHH